MGKNKEVLKYDLENNIIERFKNCQEASQRDNISIYILRRHLYSEKPINNYIYRYSGSYSDEIDKSEYKFKCPYCDEVFKTYNGLTKHVIRFKKHGEISQEKLLADFAYGGVRPRCKCGCGEYTDISYENGAHFCDYKLGHHKRKNIISNIKKEKYIIDINYNWIDDFNNFLKTLEIKTDISFYSCDLIKNSELYVKDNYNLSLIENNNNSILIFEDEWRYKKEIVKSRIKNILGLNKTKIYARKCVIKELKYSDCRNFLNENHIQGAISGKYYLGLFYNNELVSLMTFGDLRMILGSKKEENTYELLRFCNKLNTSVIGGASKLFKYFLKKYSPNKIISYCDKRWSRGNLYETLGFNLIRESKPNYYYINKFLNKRENRFKYRKNKLIEDGFDENQSEREIMKSRMIYRIYDCGNKVFLYNNI